MENNLKLHYTLSYVSNEGKVGVLTRDLKCG